MNREIEIAREVQSGCFPRVSLGLQVLVWPVRVVPHPKLAATTTT